MEKGNSEFIGFLVPKETDHCLRLLSAIEDKGKGAVLREILSTYLDHKGWDPHALVGILAQQLYSRWYTIYRDKKNLDAYLQGVKENLENRHKLPKKLITKIAQRCKELQKKKQKQESKSK
jgi:hypothetical protein